MPPYYHQFLLLLDDDTNNLLDAITANMGCSRTHLLNRALNVLEATQSVPEALEWVHSDLLKYGSNQPRNDFQQNYKQFYTHSYRVGTKDKYDWITIKFESTYHQVINRRYIFSKLLEYTLNHKWHLITNLEVGVDD